jgi:hypothetical protein
MTVGLVNQKKLPAQTTKPLVGLWTMAGVVNPWDSLEATGAEPACLYAWITKIGILRPRGDPSTSSEHHFSPWKFDMWLLGQPDRTKIEFW